MFIKRISDIIEIRALETQNDEEHIFGELPTGIMIYEITGALFFGATQSFQDALRQTNQKPRIIILNLRRVPFIDATGLYRLKEIIKEFNLNGSLVYLTEFSPALKMEFIKSHIEEVALLHPNLRHCIEEAVGKLQLNDRKSALQ